MSLKVAIVGCGKIADGHVEEIQKLAEKARLVAVCDREMLMAEQLAVRYRIPAHYDDFEALLEKERPDVVHITTPPQAHLALTKQAVDAGCHVYVEKPLTLNFQDSVELVRVVEAAGKKLTIGYPYLYDPPAVALREMVAEGKLGEIVHAECTFGYNLAGPFGKAILGDSSHWVHKLPGKLFHNNIDHILYRLAEFIPDEAPCIKAAGYSRRTERFGDERDDMFDELRFMLLGRTVSGYGLFSSHAKPVGNVLRVYGTRNTAHVDYNSRTLVLDPQSTLPGVFGRIQPAFALGKQYKKQGWGNVRRFLKHDFQYFSGMQGLISQFYDCISHKSEPPVVIKDILRISRMMDEIFRQVAVGGCTAE
jgi:predicted dehydrogenase